MLTTASPTMVAVLVALGARIAVIRDTGRRVECDLVDVPVDHAQRVANDPLLRAIASTGEYVEREIRLRARQRRQQSS